MLKREDIRIRDPFILPYEGKYYLYGTGTPGAENIDLGRQFWCYISEDLENWSDPICCFDAPADFWGEKNFWAPEVHIYHGKFYLFGTFMAEGKNRATQALVADTPEGPYRVFGEPLTPAEWMCLDGTLYIENEKPYLVFCHEWLQVGDGEICALPLTADLSAPAGEPKLLFRASEAQWALPAWHSDRNGRDDNLVTDGPFFYKMESGALAMLWSSGGHPAPGQLRRYVQAAAISESGSLFGPWSQNHPLLFTEDGGHGMIFTDLQGQKRLCLHAPNSKSEHLTLFELYEKDGVLSLGAPK